MRCLLLASIVILALGATADSAPPGGWEAYAAAPRRVPFARPQPRGAPPNWRTPGVPNKISPNGFWSRGYGRFGYGWYNVYGGYVGSDYSTIGYGYGYGYGYSNRPSDPWSVGNTAR